MHAVCTVLLLVSTTERSFIFLKYQVFNLNAFSVFGTFIFTNIYAQIPVVGV